MRSLLLLLMATPLALLAAEERPYYMWVDESGVFNISQVQPPASVGAREVFDEKAREEFESSGRPGRVEQDESADENGGNGQPLPEVAVDLPWNQDQVGNQSVDELSAEARQLNCSLSRQVLRRLGTHKNIFMKDRQGLWRQLSPERVEAEKLKAQQTINANCDPTDLQ